MLRRGRLAILAAAFIGLPALAGIGYYRVRPWQSDFLLYYRDARVGWVFGWSHLYDLANWDTITQQLGIHSQDPNSGSLSLPLLSWLVAPFALLPMPLAYAAWVVTLLATAAGVWWVLAPRTPGSEWTQLALALVFLPLVFAVSLGSAVVLAFGAVAGCWWLSRMRHDLAAGLLLAALLVRPQVALLVPLCLLLAGRVRLFAGFLVGVATVGAVTLLTIPASSIVAYLHTMTGVAQHPVTWQVASELTLSNLRPAPVGLALALAAALVAGLIAALNRRAPEPEAIAITAGLVGSILITPYVHLQDLTMLLAAAWLWLRVVPSSWAPLVLIAVAGVSNFAMSIHTPLPAFLESAWLVLLLATTIRQRNISALPVAA